MYIASSTYYRPETRIWTLKVLKKALLPPRFKLLHYRPWCTYVTFLQKAYEKLSLGYYHIPAIYTTIKCMGKKTLIFMVYLKKQTKKLPKEPHKKTRKPNKPWNHAAKPCNIKHKLNITDNAAFAFSTSNFLSLICTS